MFYAGLKNSQELSFTVHAVDFQGGCKLFATLVFLRTDQGCNCVPFYDANSKLLYCKVVPREIAASDTHAFLGVILPRSWERSHGRRNRRRALIDHSAKALEGPSRECVSWFNLQRLLK